MAYELVWSSDSNHLYCGDCIEVLADMPENSVDAIVTDPPYGLEFMGKEWDKLAVPKAGHLGGFADGNKPSFERVKKHLPVMQEWHYNWALAAFRVLKPGGPILAFGGTRTHHRLACALEDAGFEIRDCLMWLYGCLSEDTEVLIDGRWGPYHKAIVGQRALCYNSSDDTFSWQPIQQVFVYPYDDTAYRIRSDSTDQIVSRNHRCLVERGGTLVFEFAEEAARQCQARVPILEDLPGLLATLPLPHEGAGSQESLLLGGLCPEESRQAQAIVGAQGAGDALCCVQEKDLETGLASPEDTDTNMLTPLQRHATGGGVGQAGAQRPSSLDRCLAAILPGEDDWPEQSCLEGRRDILQEAWQLRPNQIRAMSNKVPADGSQGRLCNGAPPDRGYGSRKDTTANRSCTSYESRPDGQSYKESTTICKQHPTQVVRRARFAIASLAKIIPIHYKGIMWCISVPTGAFVARRNGQVFITGNSGFPKSLDVSKAVDKVAGAKREKRDGGAGPGFQRNIGNTHPWMEEENHQIDETAPATDTAHRWQGWGTALKPAWEPIILARKPLSEKNVAANILKWGVGALNIDGGRLLARGQAQTQGEYRGSVVDVVGARGGGKIYAANLGRFPANLLLSHTPECRCTGTRQVKSDSHWSSDDGSDATNKPGYGGGFTRGGHRSGHTDDIGKETVEQWECSPDCPVRLLNEQGSAPGYGLRSPHYRRGQASRGGALNFGSKPEGQVIGYGDDTNVRGPSRFFYCAKASRKERRDSKHPTIKPLALIRYLCRLITPPGGDILDPFAGSGTTLEAAIAEGFTCMGIDKSPEYCQDAIRRLDGTGAQD